MEPEVTWQAQVLESLQFDCEFRARAHANVHDTSLKGTGKVHTAAYRAKPALKQMRVQDSRVTMCGGRWLQCVIM